MNTENLDQSQNTSTQNNQDNNPNPNPHVIPEETKNLLISLLKERLNGKITKLEKKINEGQETLKHVNKKFTGYIALLDAFVIESKKNLQTNYEILKKKEEEKKSKEKTKPHTSKSLAPHKKLEISIRNDFMTNRTGLNKNKNKINVNINNISRHNFQTEIPKKEPERSKTFKGRKIHIEKDSNRKIKPKPIKVDKISDISTPIRPDDNKAKTIMNYNTEKKPETRPIHNSVINNNKSKSIKKKIKGNHLELSKNFSDMGTSIKKFDKFTSEKVSKKSINIIHDKSNKKNEDKENKEIKENKENKKETGKKLVNKKIYTKIKKPKPKTEKKEEAKKEEKKEDKKISKDETNEIKEEKKEQNNEEEKEKENKNGNKENINEETTEKKISEEKKEDINLNMEEKKDEIENKNDNKEKTEQKEEKTNTEEPKKQDESKNEENKIQIEKENKLDNVDINLDTPKDEKVNDSDKKDEIKVDNIVDKKLEIPKEEKVIDSEKKDENKNENEAKETTKTEKEIKSISPEETLQKELKKEEQKIIQENESNSLLTQKEDAPKNDAQIKQEEKEPKKEEPQSHIEETPSEPKKIPSEENKDIQVSSNKEEEKKTDNANNENQNKPKNENNINLIETIRKDNEEKNKDNDDELLKHYQSQLNINLNQSINQSMSFSQSFLNSRSILGEKPLEKLNRDPNAPLTKDDMLKKYKNHFIYIFDFLDFKDRVMFSGIHKGFKNERIYLLNTKREEAIASLELNERETITDRLNKFMSSYSSSEYTQPLGPFTPARNSANAILSIDKPAFNKIFTQKILDIKLSQIYIVYRVLFVLLGEQKIAEIIDDGEFWVKCIEYLNEKSNNKIGSFILEKSKSFDFSKNSIYLINKLLVGIKPNFTTAHFSKINGPTGLVLFIIRDALEYAGIIVTKKTPKSRIYNNLVYYKNIIENLNNFIDYLANIGKK